MFILRLDITSHCLFLFQNVNLGRHYPVALTLARTSSVLGRRVGESSTDLHDLWRERVQLPGHDPGQKPLQKLPARPALLGKTGDHVAPQQAVPFQPQANVDCRLRRSADTGFATACADARAVTLPPCILQTYLLIATIGKIEVCQDSNIGPVRMTFLRICCRLPSVCAAAFPFLA